MARVLIVDDEALVREVVRTVLEQAGHEVIEIDDGAAALRADLDGVDLIITDLIMPTPGSSFVQEVRRRGQQTPIVVMSAYLSQQEWDRVGESSVDAFLEKPVTLDSLLAVVARLLP